MPASFFGRKMPVFLWSDIKKMLHAPILSLAVRELIFKLNPQLSKPARPVPQLPLDGVYSFYAQRCYFHNIFHFLILNFISHFKYIWKQSGYKTLLNKLNKNHLDIYAKERTQSLFKWLSGSIVDLLIQAC